jgi:hypothetical protein
MKQITYINISISLYITLLFLFFQPSVFPFSLDYITTEGDSYYFSLILRFVLFFIIIYITYPIVYYLVNHIPHHPN